jgi:predicted nuclease with TOPRIM domain
MNVMGFEKFDILEEKVNLLAEKYAELKSQKDNFTQSVQQKEQELSQLQDKVRVLEEEKETIKGRLDRIISSLETISFHS